MFHRLTSHQAPQPPLHPQLTVRLAHSACLAIRNHLPLAECAHFRQHRTAQALYDAVVARYSAPATAALGRLLLPYLFPELSAFATVEDLVSHLCASNARYRVAAPAEFFDKNQPPMFITLFFIVTCLPDSPRSVRDHFLSLDPTSLTVDLLEQHLLAAETSAVAVGAACGTPCMPFFEGCSPSPLAPSYTSAAAVDVLSTEDVRAACTIVKSRRSKGKGGRGGGGGSGSGGGGSSVGSGGSGGGGSGGSGGKGGGIGGGGGGSGGSGGSGSGGSGGGRTGAQRGGSGGGQRQWQQRRSETPLPQYGVAIFDLDYDAILSAMYTLSASADGDCYRCVPPDPGIDAAALGASESVLPGTAPAEGLHTFTLDSSASRCFFRDSTTLTPLPAPVLVRLADPSGGPVVAHSSTVLPCPAVSASAQVAPLCSCRLLSHQTLLWHHRLGHPSLPRLCDMHSRLLGSGLPRSLPPLPPSPAPPCLPCVEGRQRAAPHSSSFPLTTAPLQTLHMDSVSCSASGSVRTFVSCVCTLTEVQNGIAERCIGLVMEVARTSMIHATAPHFLWLFAVRNAAHQLNLWPRVSFPETSPTLRWTGKVGDASVFRVWGSRAFVRDTSADKLSSRAIPCVFLGFTPDAPGWQFYHHTSHHVFLSQDITFDESVPFYRLFPYHSAPPPPPLLFLAPGPPPVDPLPPQGPSPSSVSQVDPLPGTAPFEVAVGSSAAQGAVSGGAASEGAEPGVAESEGAGSGGAEPGGEEPGVAEPAGVEPGGAEPEGVEPGGAESEGAESGGAEPQGAALSGGPAGALPRLSLQQLREWLVRRTRLQSGATRNGGVGAAGAGGAAGVTTGAGGTGGTTATGPGGARSRGTGAAATGAVGGAGAGDPMEQGAAGAGGSGAGGPGAEGAGAGGTATRGTGVGGTGAGGAGAAGPGVVDPGGTVRPRPFFVPLLQQVLGVPSSASLTPPLLCPPPDQSHPPLQPASPLPAPSPYTEQTGGLTERREPASRPVLPVCTARRGPCLRPPPVPGTHAMALRPSSSDHARAASPTVSRLLATTVIDPSFESAAESALVAELLDFAAACRLDYAAALVAESESASPPSVGGECVFGTDVLEDRQEDFECLAAAVPYFASMLLAPEGDPDAPDIPTPRSYGEAITGPYSSQWQAAMDAKMAYWISTGTYVYDVPPPGANIGVDYFETFSPTLKITTLWVLLHVAAQRDYELHSLDFSTAFLQGNLHEEIWLRHPSGFTGSFPAGTQWSLQRPVYGLRQAPREWHDTVRTTLAALGFAPSTADPSLFLRTDTSLPLFYVLVYVDDLVFATADTKALTLVNSELQKRHTCTDLGELRSYLGLRITKYRARRTITLTQSHMVHQVLQRFCFLFSSPQPTPLSTGHSLSAPPSDESVEPSGPYPELVDCLMYLMTCTRPDLAYPLSLLARYVAPGRHRKVHWDAAKRVLHYLCSTLGMGLVLGGRARVVLTGHADASWVDDSATQRSSQGYTFSLCSGSISWRSTRSSSVLSSSCEVKIYVGAMAAQKLRWLTYLLTDLGEKPRSPPVMYVDNKAMIALCQEHRLEHRTKHIALRYFLAHELQQRGQLRLAYVATRANTVDIFTKAVPPGDHQHFSTVLGLVPILPHLLTA
ncbi:unnamed protein product [Closterium sp. NIES-54]